MSQEPTNAQVRPGVEADLAALTDLYNHYVRETHVTFDTAPFAPEERHSWLLAHQGEGPHRLMVAQSPDSPRLLGYATTSAFRPKPGYATSVEFTIYLAPDASGRGIGTRLYEALFEALAGQDLHRAYAGIALPNEPSRRLHERFGFRHLGTFREVGRKFGRYWDVAWFEKEL